ncbi:ABC-2 type transport system ATP-binding protein [Idiomarina fontislapidosi]|uniref:Na+ ABC transporter ATP-binding protein n=1 Tax=Idiomarina fontislapidosi TaxID=263723 RepID=A0A432XTY1_9GAMM|nr:ATP-binding cassette domain-containing protein [Idiomarina fontislapidosi]PYE31566.1 ABC-2 type transport system ATP-binding protein [Idiomarina fontislapidosi]RUO52198.1 Na+ ABC transporter ATP-binding protein [Idiomarina fontislapidosi]|tara:strand:+ start:1698 stop:2645 length:948 start_codon:yes stop_codon:yes gene_type:complete
MNIQITNLTKRYKTVTAVDNISLTVNSGEIYALLGPNGAGKSSLVRMLVGLTQADEGSIEISNSNGPRPQLSPEDFAYLPEDRGLYQDRTILDNLGFIAELRGLDKSLAQQRIEQWLEYFDLSERKKEPMRQLSKGNQQKVQLIATLLHDPDLVILDEPFSGLDPVNQEHVMNVLTELKQRGKTVLLSAHQMALVERLADKMLLMSHGRALAQGTLAEIRATLQPQRVYRIECNAQMAQAHWHQHDGIVDVTEIDNDVVHVIVDPYVDVEQLWPQLNQQVPMRSFSPLQLGLHEMYLNTIEQNNNKSKDIQHELA